MVFESLISPLMAEKHPVYLIPWGFFSSILGLIVGLVFFPQEASLVMILFVCISSVPLLYNLIRYEEDKDLRDLKERILIKEHSKAVLAYFCLFVGVTLGFVLAFLVLPDPYFTNVFSAQIDTYKTINPSHQITGNATQPSYFQQVLFNNLRVLILCILFSFVYGVGAIFILSWNASVLAVAIGNTIANQLQSLSSNSFVGLSTKLAVGSHVLFLRYGLHGALEILSYLFAGLSGGIISVAVIRHHYKSKHFEHIVLDSADLILLSVVLLVLAALVETFITPFFYL